MGSSLPTILQSLFLQEALLSIRTTLHPKPLLEVLGALAGLFFSFISAYDGQWRSLNNYLQHSAGFRVMTIVYFRLLLCICASEAIICLFLSHVSLRVCLFLFAVFLSLSLPVSPSPLSSVTLWPCLYGPVLSNTPRVSPLSTLRP